MLSPVLNDSNVSFICNYNHLKQNKNHSKTCPGVNLPQQTKTELSPLLQPLNTKQASICAGNTKSCLVLFSQVRIGKKVCKTQGKKHAGASLYSSNKYVFAVGTSYPSFRLITSSGHFGCKE